MLKIEHLGIAVKDLEASNTLYQKLLGQAPYKTETVESEQVSTSFFKIGESKIELLQATGTQSAIAKYIDKKGEGIHHIAFAADSVSDELARLNNEGISLINNEPRNGAHDMLIAFLHPKSTGGVLMELCQPMEK